MRKKRKITIFTILCLVSAAVWYTWRPESTKLPTLVNLESKSDIDSPDAFESPGTSKPIHRIKKLRELLSQSDRINNLAQQYPHLEDEDAPSTFDRIPEQKEWRVAWRDEEQDDDWTKRMEKNVKEKARSDLVGKVKIFNLSCHETICRMHLQFEDEIDAETFISAKQDPDMRYEYRLLNPDDETADNDQREKKYNYELLVQRPRPQNLPKRDYSVESNTPSPAAGVVLAGAGQDVVQENVIREGSENE